MTTLKEHTTIPYHGMRKDLKSVGYIDERISDISEAISSGLMPTFDYVMLCYGLPESMQNENRLYTTETDLHYSKLDTLCSKDHLSEILEKHLNRHRYKKTAIFVENTEDVLYAREVIMCAFPDAKCFETHNGKTEVENKIAVDEFERQTSPAFIVCAGSYDLHEISSIIMFRQTKDTVDYLNTLEKVIASAKGKRQIIIFDFVLKCDTLQQFGMIQENEVITDINSRMSDPKRQVFRYDYTRQTADILGRLKSLLGVNVPWSQEEITFLEDNKDMAIPEVAKILTKRTYAAISIKRNELQDKEKEPAVNEAINNAEIELAKEELIATKEDYEPKHIEDHVQKETISKSKKPIAKKDKKQDKLEYRGIDISTKTATAKALGKKSYPTKQLDNNGYSVYDYIDKEKFGMAYEDIAGKTRCEICHRLTKECECKKAKKKKK